MTYVLLAEHDDAAATALERLLLEGAFSVIRAETLLSARTVLRNRAVDLVLLGFALSDVSGIDAVVAIRREEPELPLLVVGEHDDVTAAVACAAEGAQGYLVGPTLTVDALQREILCAIERTRKLLYVRQLLRATLSQHTRGAALLRGHTEALERAFDELCRYLQRNSPTSYEAVELILEKHRSRDVMQELRTLTVDSENTEASALHYISAAFEGLHSTMDALKARVTTVREETLKRYYWRLCLWASVAALSGAITGVLFSYAHFLGRLGAEGSQCDAHVATPVSPSGDL